ncbi:hypothetical protein JL720_7858 [Aureococcus anophagefferens]|nr:hypothetical protein JL720_7858 [Aureococcus anophagefferens]
MLREMLRNDREPGVKKRAQTRRSASRGAAPGRPPGRAARAPSGDAALDALLAKAARSRPVTAPDARRGRKPRAASDGALDASDEADEDDDEPLVRDIEEASYVTACKVSNKGDVIASSSTDNTCKLWDAFSGELLKTLDGHESFCLSCNFSPDGKRLMTTSDDQTAILWDAATGEILHKLEGHTDKVSSGAFSPDGLRVVTGSLDMTAKIWDATTGACEHAHGPQRLDPRATGATTASASSRRRRTRRPLWDSERAEFQKEIKGHQGTVTSCAFSKDDKVVVTGSLDHTAKLWHSWRTTSASTPSTATRTTSPASPSPPTAPAS